MKNKTQSSFVEETKNFVRVQLKPSTKFDKRSFRTKTLNGKRLVVGCPKGKWDAKKSKCKVGTQAQALLIPRRSNNPAERAAKPLYNWLTQDRVTKSALNKAEQFIKGKKRQDIREHLAKLTNKRTSFRGYELERQALLNELRKYKFGKKGWTMRKVKNPRIVAFKPPKAWAKVEWFEYGKVDPDWPIYDEYLKKAKKFIKDKGVDVAKMRVEELGEKGVHGMAWNEEEIKAVQLALTKKDLTREIKKEIKAEFEGKYGNLVDLKKAKRSKYAANPELMIVNPRVKKMKNPKPTYYIIKMTKSWEDMGYIFKKGTVWLVNDGGTPKSTYWFMGTNNISKDHSKKLAKLGKDRELNRFLKEYYGVNPKTAKNPIDTNSKAYKDAVKMYKKFHGTEPMEVVPVMVPEGSPKVMVSLGKAVDVSYKVPEHSKKSGLPFLHKFKDGDPRSKKNPLLLTDSKGKNLIFGRPKGSKMKVTERGIVG